MWHGNRTPVSEINVAKSVPKGVMNEDEAILVRDLRLLTLYLPLDGRGNHTSWSFLQSSTPSTMIVLKARQSRLSIRQLTTLFKMVKQSNQCPPIVGCRIIHISSYINSTPSLPDRQTDRHTPLPLSRAANAERDEMSHLAEASVCFVVLLLLLSLPLL